MICSRVLGLPCLFIFVLVSPLIFFHSVCSGRGTPSEIRKAGAAAAYCVLPNAWQCGSWGGVMAHKAHNSVIRYVYIYICNCIYIYFKIKQKHIYWIITSCHTLVLETLLQKKCMTIE